MLKRHLLTGSIHCETPWKTYEEMMSLGANQSIHMLSVNPQWRERGSVIGRWPRTAPQKPAQVRRKIEDAPDWSRLSESGPAPRNKSGIKPLYKARQIDSL